MIGVTRQRPPVACVVVVGSVSVASRNGDGGIDLELRTCRALDRPGRCVDIRQVGSGVADVHLLACRAVSRVWVVLVPAKTSVGI